MSRTRNIRLASVLGSGALVATSMFVGPAAHAAEASGTQSCTGTKEVRLTINAASSGTGTWINRATGASRTFYFSGGETNIFAPYKSVRWSVTATRFYSTPTTTCI